LQISSKSFNYIFVKPGYKLVKITFDEIVYIEGMKDYQRIFTVNEKIMVMESMAELEKLPPSSFIRYHKSFIVSIPKIESIERNRIKTGHRYIPIGDTYKESFYKTIGR
jgi:DNA-binding LytR/AlgR family response regulator